MNERRKLISNAYKLIWINFSLSHGGIFNLLLHDFYFTSTFEILPRIASLRLPTHIDAALIGNFFDDPFLFQN